MQRLTLMIAAAAVLLAGTVANAQPWTAEDYADDAVYDVGWTTGDNGGFGFSGGWTVTITDFGAPASSVAAVDATTNGGDASMNQNDEAWRMEVGPVDGISAGRPFAATRPADTIYSWEMQSEVTSLISSSALRTGSNNIVSLNNAAGANWVITGRSGGGTIDTSIPIARPIRVLVTKTTSGTPNAYIVEVVDMTGVSSSYTEDPFTPAQTGNPDEFFFTATSSDFATTRYAWINSLIIDETGTVPVELDSFMVE